MGHMAAATVQCTTHNENLRKMTLRDDVKTMYHNQALKSPKLTHHNICRTDLHEDIWLLTRFAMFPYS